ncbi:UDP-glucose 6-dehydrogenase [Amycolatopsis thailandensis]|uniref:UDP-glucose 6-dehydrogenase n=1 Tax=Amycolatopsis thailandensis TaxID=589330 RepID=A0A229RRR7_9PSEU|nr:UDP-glucose/GDP-mannose dehydrogenase family protein [Amycolatopsis thailandensis]OXM49362.1 UDP-glucose 6-dehydrogenase [Amycolatopsis thailandensis]
MAERRIVVIGTGYVGLTTGACLASLGHQVMCVDIDVEKIDRLRAGRIPMLEPGLADLVRDGQVSGRLEFTVDGDAAVAGTEFLFLCLPTPKGADGGADLRATESTVARIRDTLPVGCVVVNKSTVPVGTSVRIAGLLDRPDVAVVSNPEFLREGSAVTDFLKPDRIVVGADVPEAGARVAGLYSRLRAPVLVTDAASAELVKYVANCFLAMKLSFVNAVAEMCEHFDADVDEVLDAVGRDPRIGRSYLRPGPGWGGSCLPKDSDAMLRMADTVGFSFPLLRATIESNAQQLERVVTKLATAFGGSLDGARVGLLGLTFKAGTNDLRGSPALAVAELLAARGAELLACDPTVAGGTEVDGITVMDDPYQVAENAEALVLLTDWPQFRALDWVRMAKFLDGTVVLDTRNHLDPEKLGSAGLVCHGIGRSLKPRSWTGAPPAG